MMATFKWVVKNIVKQENRLSLNQIGVLSCVCKELRDFFYIDSFWINMFSRIWEDLPKFMEPLLWNYNSWREMFIDYYVIGTYPIRGKHFLFNIMPEKYY